MKALRQQLVREVRERIPRYDEYRHVYCLDNGNNTEFSDISQWTPIDPSTLPQSPKPCIRSNNNSDEENETNSDIDMQSTPVSLGLSTIGTVSSLSAEGDVNEGKTGNEGKGEESSTSAVIEMPIISSTESDIQNINSTAATPVVENSSSSSSANTVVVWNHHLF